MSQVKSFTGVDGKRYRVNPKVPLADIKWIVNRYHVSKHEQEIVADIMGRTQTWPETARKVAVAYALRCHQKNQELVYKFLF